MMCALRQAQDGENREWLLPDAAKKAFHPELVEGRTTRFAVPNHLRFNVSAVLLSSRVDASSCPIATGD
jgi:hypothetical protein